MNLDGLEIHSLSLVTFRLLLVSNHPRYYHTPIPDPCRVLTTFLRHEATMANGESESDRRN